MIVVIAIYPTNEHDAFGLFDTFSAADDWIKTQRHDVQWIARALRSKNPELTEEKKKAFPDYEKAMDEEGIPQILESFNSRAALADEARQRIL